MVHVFMRFWSRIMKIGGSGHQLNASLLLPAALLTIYSLLGAAIFYGTEHNGKCPMTFWEALYFASTLYTTIGKYIMYICTGWPRVSYQKYIASYYLYLFIYYYYSDFGTEDKV